MIKDKKLQLALLDEIQENYDWVEDMSEEYESTRLNKPEWVSWTTIEEDEEPELKPSLEEFLLTLQLPNNKLLKIETLTLDGDRGIYQWIYPYWWDFGDHFVIKSLDGIQYCKNLKYLNLGTLTQQVNLQPLTRLPNLEKLVLSSYNATNYKVLLQLKSLNTLEVYNWVSFSDDEKAELVPILKQLQKNNCELIFHPKTNWED